MPKSYTVFRKQTNPGTGAVRFKKLGSFNYDELDMSQFDLSDNDRTVRAVAIAASGRYSIAEGEFLVHYCATGDDEYCALVKVSRPTPIAEVIS